MRVSRIYYSADIAPRQVFEVDGKVHHYLSRVLRLKVGHAVRFFNGKGREFLCMMTKSNQRGSTFVCRHEVEILPEPKLKIKLYLAVCKNESMDFSVQKATELGVQELQPLITERSLTHRTAHRRRLHWQGVAKSACEQCGRAIVPKIAEPIALQEVVKIGGDDKAIVCCFDTRTSINMQAYKFLTKLSNREAMLHLMIGPEGGFSSNEVARTISLGFEAVRLGCYVLRTETAVTAVLSIVRFAYTEDALNV